MDEEYGWAGRQRHIGIKNRDREREKEKEREREKIMRYIILSDGNSERVEKDEKDTPQNGLYFTLGVNQKQKQQTTKQIELHITFLL